MVGDTGIEPVTSSVSTRSGPIRYVDILLYALLAGLVSIGLGGCCRRCFARSSPRFLPSEGADHLCGHPVAQAPPGRAAPAWSRWSTPLSDRPGPGGRGLAASRCAMDTRQALTSQSGPGPGRVALAA